MLPRVLPLLILAASCWASWRWLRVWASDKIVQHNSDNCPMCKERSARMQNGARSSEATRGR